jgi:hypothetical protein
MAALLINQRFMNPQDTIHGQDNIRKRRNPGNQVISTVKSFQFRVNKSFCQGIDTSYH